MNAEARVRLNEAQKMLVDANALNETGKPSVAIENAYNASEHIAWAYLYEVGKQRPLAQYEDVYERFSKTVREIKRHAAFFQRIREVVGDVAVLREAYEPALLDETTIKDAQQMIGHVDALRSLIEDKLP